MHPLNEPEVSRKWSVFEKCPSGDPKTTGRANVILENNPCRKIKIFNNTKIHKSVVRISSN